MTRQSSVLFLVFLFCALTGCATGGSVSKSEQKKQAESARLLGEAYLQDRNYTQALAQFLKAESMDDDDYVLQKDLGDAFTAKGDQDTAIAHYKKALDIKPDYAEARNNLGVVYLAMEEWDLAIENFNFLTKDLLYGTPQYPLVNLGKAYYEKKAYDEAEKYYKKALDIQPGFANALYGIGKTYLAMGKLQDAVESFEKAVAIAPEVAEVHFVLAETYRLLGEGSKAKDEYEKVVSLAPDSDMARESKQELYRKN